MNFSWEEIICVYIFIVCHIGQKRDSMFISRIVEFGTNEK
jgi:type IV secretory pathway VirB3-like protein